MPSLTTSNCKNPFVTQELVTSPTFLLLSSTLGLASIEGPAHVLTLSLHEGPIPHIVCCTFLPCVDSVASQRASHLLSASDVLQLGRQGPDGGEGSRLTQAASSLPASREQDQVFRVRNLKESLMTTIVIPAGSWQGCTVLPKNNPSYYFFIFKKKHNFNF